jgi:hypothetical protein
MAGTNRMKNEQLPAVLSSSFHKTEQSGNIWWM